MSEEHKQKIREFIESIKKDKPKDESTSFFLLDVIEEIKQIYKKNEEF